MSPAPSASRVELQGGNCWRSQGFLVPREIGDAKRTPARDQGLLGGEAASRRSPQSECAVAIPVPAASTVRGNRPLDHRASPWAGRGSRASTTPGFTHLRTGSGSIDLAVRHGLELANRQLHLSLATVSLMLTDRVTHFPDDQVDAAVRVGTLPDSRLIAIRLGEIRHVMFTSPHYLASNGISSTPEDLARHSVISFEGVALPTTWTFGSHGAERRVTFRARPSVDSLDAAIDAELAGAGLLRAMSYQVVEHLRAGRMKVVLEPFERPPAPVHLVCVRQNRQRRAACRAAKRKRPQTTSASGRSLRATSHRQVIAARRRMYHGNVGALHSWTSGPRRGSAGQRRRSSRRALESAISQ